MISRELLTAEIINSFKSFPRSKLVTMQNIYFKYRINPKI